MSKGGIIALVIVGLLVLAGLGVGLYMLTKKKKSPPSSSHRPSSSSSSSKARCYMVTNSSGHQAFQFDTNNEQFFLDINGRSNYNVAYLEFARAAFLTTLKKMGEITTVPMCGIKQPNGASLIKSTDVSKDGTTLTLSYYDADPYKPNN